MNQSQERFMSLDLMQYLRALQAGLPFTLRPAQGILMLGGYLTWRSGRLGSTTKWFSEIQGNHGDPRIQGFNVHNFSHQTAKVG